jgi:hypothetical protein
MWGCLPINAGTYSDEGIGGQWTIHLIVALSPYLYVNKYAIHVSSNGNVKQLGTTLRLRKWPWIIKDNCKHNNHALLHMPIKILVTRERQFESCAWSWCIVVVGQNVQEEYLFRQVVKWHKREQYITWLWPGRTRQKQKQKHMRHAGTNPAGDSKN